jgi:hypothetical protein
MRKAPTTLEDYLICRYFREVAENVVIISQ